jgi:poly(3-hydroxybutyrate) depolymerase
VTARQVEGSLYEYSVVFAGQPDVVEDADGHVVARDQGVRRLTILFDTGGDEDPAKDALEVVGFHEAGLHDVSAVDSCRFVGDLAGIGSTSSQRYTLRPAGSTASPLGYGEYLPSSYGVGGPSPLLVFLHGAGEGGDGSTEDLTHLAWNAIPRYVANDLWPGERPFVVLAPQHDDTVNPPEYGDDYGACESEDFPGSCWLTVQHRLGNPTPGSPCFVPDEVRDFIDYAVSAYDVDPSRVYLTGLSCGGYGTWEYLADNGGSQVAAAVPVAGEGRPAWDTAGCDLADVPVWAFHGALDDVVDPQGSIVPVTRLRTTCGVAEVGARLTVYPDLDHDSWDLTYGVGGPHDVYGWLLARSST